MRQNVYLTFYKNNLTSFKVGVQRVQFAANACTMSGDRTQTETETEYYSLKEVATQTILTKH